MYKTNTIQCLGNSNNELFFSLKPTGQHSFMNQKQEKEREGHDKCSNWIFWRDPVSFSSLFPSCPVLMGDRTWLPSVVWSLFEMFHLLIFFSLIVLCCETVSPPGRSTHSVREKRLTFNSKTSSGNRNHVINKKNAQVLTYLSILLYYSSYNSWSLSVVSFFFFFSFLNLPEWSYRSVWEHHMNVYWTCLWRCVSVRKVCVFCFFSSGCVCPFFAHICQNILCWSLPKAQDFTKCSCQLGPPFGWK